MHCCKHFFRILKYIVLIHCNYTVFWYLNWACQAGATSLLVSMQGAMPLTCSVPSVLQSKRCISFPWTQSRFVCVEDMHRLLITDIKHNHERVIYAENKMHTLFALTDNRRIHAGMNTVVISLTCCQLNI